VLRLGWLLQGAVTGETRRSWRSGSASLDTPQDSVTFFQTMQPIVVAALEFVCQAD
jgi:hypothetical protein